MRLATLCLLVLCSLLSVRSKKLTANICYLPPETGPCRAAIPRWYFNPETGKCETFIYGGCKGNENKFESEAACKARCQPKVTNVCELKPDAGPCEALIPRWFFNTKTGRCEKFTFGGCQGNANNFETEAACKARCQPKVTDVCELKPDAGPCLAIFQRWYFNPKTERCETFIYGGCRGNANNFETAAACKDRCQPKVTNVCYLRADPGPCKAAFPRWFFNAETGRCEQFTYGGCQGNANNFESIGECQQACRKNCKFVRCFEDPCAVTTCDAFPEAKCVANYCTGCDADFYLNGKLVNCDAVKPGNKLCLPEGASCRNPNAMLHSSHVSNFFPACCKGLTCCACGPPVVSQHYVPSTFGTCKARCICPRG